MLTDLFEHPEVVGNAVSDDCQIWPSNMLIVGETLIQWGIFWSTWI